jgi:hypothetical protein
VKKKSKILTQQYQHSDPNPDPNPDPNTDPNTDPDPNLEEKTTYVALE